MRTLRYLVIIALLALGVVAVNQAGAQVAVGVGIGPVYAPVPVAYGPPVCDWGYYPYYPYACAPYGYYGPSWFVNGLFIGVGPWYHWGYYHPYYYGYRGYYGGGYGYRPGYSGYHPPARPMPYGGRATINGYPGYTHGPAGAPVNGIHNYGAAPHYGNNFAGGTHYGGGMNYGGGAPHYGGGMGGGHSFGGGGGHFGGGGHR